MKNILVIHQSAELYGSDKTLLVVLSQLDKKDFFPVVVLPFEGPLKTELEKEGIKVVIAPVLKLYRKMFTPKNLLALAKGANSAIKTLDELHAVYKFDMVYSNTLAVLLGMIYARKRKLKHIWHVHEIITTPKVIANTFAWLLDRYATLVVCNSYATKNNLTSRQKTLESKTVVVHNGLNALPQTQHQPSTKTKYGFEETDVVITLLGRIGWFKGHKWLLNTYIENFKNSNVKMLFVGSPVPGQEHYQDEVEAIIAQHNLQDSVKIIAFTTNVQSIWNATDITAVPSTEAEPFGLVALEGMLAKKPVVASNHGGLTEIVVDKQTGFLVEPGNNESLAKALKNLIDNPQLRNEFGAKGYERAISQFSQDQYVKGMVDIFAGKVSKS
ncbi:glycosyltransferase [Flavobacterium sp. Sd200]|uniref:glycosyltransferase family 4 protein n=1 Tax=Flavobacterium sp. Sd200 TaxID=2692211 RepID=UPI00136EE72A|nr:glycosyltransferase family 4 protein [Flavobacterium sp. Sd200]MXN92581.1 glycosyltransferase [Flavobacterium sp. Sd200]